MSKRLFSLCKNLEIFKHLQRVIRKPWLWSIYYYCYLPWVECSNLSDTDLQVTMSLLVHWWFTIDIRLCFIIVFDNSLQDSKDTGYQSVELLRSLTGQAGLTAGFQLCTAAAAPASVCPGPASSAVDRSVVWYVGGWWNI